MQFLELHLHLVLLVQKTLLLEFFLQDPSSLLLESLLVLLKQLLLFQPLLIYPLPLHFLDLHLVLISIVK